MREIQRDLSPSGSDVEKGIQMDLFDSSFGRDWGNRMDWWNQTCRVVPGRVYSTQTGWFVDRLDWRCTTFDGRRLDSGFGWLGLLRCKKTRPGNQRDLSICCWIAVVVS